MKRPYKPIVLAHRFAYGLLFIAFIMSATLSASSLIWPNSYWLDELNSVTSSQIPFNNALPIWISETGPPLYRFLLSLWIAIFSDDEVATRFLSCIFVFASIPITFRALKNFGRSPQVISAALLATNSLIIYAANEVRPYALVVLLACTCTMLFIQKNINRNQLLALLGSCLLLSVTHYIGFIYAGIILLWLFIFNFHNRTYLIYTFISLVLLLVWPTLQATYGGLLNKSGGNFWIQVRGPLDTLQIYSSAIFPLASYKFREILGAILFISCGLISIWTAADSLNKRSFSNEEIALGKLSGLIFLFLISAMAFDLHSPISTPRNAIILVPVLCLWIALFAVKIRCYGLVFKGFFICITLLIGLNLVQAYHAVIEKIEPLQNWAASAQYIIDHQIEGPIYCFGGADYTRISNYYLKKLSNGKLEALPIRHPIETIKGPAYILYGNYGGDPSYEWLRSRAAIYDGVKQFIPPQHYSNGAEAGVFFIQGNSEPASK